ncbi:MAG: hypothetical protein N3I86_07215 [Verrucomicrobiae bacterium]|nr:hypothetical protein [Verrucomicrobiae bacterium]
MHRALLRHQPEGRNAPQLFAVSRRRQGLFDRDGAQTDAPRVIERHPLKGDKEHWFSELLNGLDLHRPPCSTLRANQVYDLIAALDCNLMAAIKLLDLNDDCQGWRVKTLMKKRLLLPGRLSRRSRQWAARVAEARPGPARRGCRQRLTARPHLESLRATPAEAGAWRSVARDRKGARL